MVHNSQFYGSPPCPAPKFWGDPDVSQFGPTASPGRTKLGYLGKLGIFLPRSLPKFLPKSTHDHSEREDGELLTAACLSIGFHPPCSHWDAGCGMGSLHGSLRDTNGSGFSMERVKNPNILTNSSRLTERGCWEWSRGDTNSSGPYLDLSGTDVKLFQDIYQEVLDFDPRINAVGSIQDDDDVHVGLASCGKSRDLLKVLLQRGRFMASLPASYFLFY